MAIAYYVVGEGPQDLVFVPFTVSMVFAWHLPVFRDFCLRVSAFSRLILFDMRGIGASDRPRTPPTLESQMEDVRVVLDAVDSEQAALFGSGHGGQMCALFAATYPERTTALVLYGSTRHGGPGTADEHRAELRRIRSEWGLQDTIERWSHGAYPSVEDDEEFRRWMPTVVRASASPSSAVEFVRTYFDTDISEVLPTIRVPTLVLYRPEAQQTTFSRSMVFQSEEEAQSLADAIPDARVVSIPGSDASPFVGTEVTDEVERFLASPHEAAMPDTVLATVLFTDIVGSTERAAEIGDSRWRELLAAHRTAVRRELALHRGHEIDVAGDGFFASFDGPARAIACARRIVEVAAGQGIRVRTGLHTGECERDGDKLAGLAVHIGARLAALAQPGEVLVSRTVKDLVAGSGIEFEDRGEHSLKGVPGKWQLYAARSD